MQPEEPKKGPITNPKEKTSKVAPKGPGKAKGPKVGRPPGSTKAAMAARRQAVSDASKEVEMDLSVGDALSPPKVPENVRSEEPELETTGESECSITAQTSTDNCFNCVLLEGTTEDEVRNEGHGTLSEIDKYLQDVVDSSAFGIGKFTSPSRDFFMLKSIRRGNE